MNRMDLSNPGLFGVLATGVKGSLASGLGVTFTEETDVTVPCATQARDALGSVKVGTLPMTVRVRTIAERHSIWIIMVMYLGSEPCPDILRHPDSFRILP